MAKLTLDDLKLDGKRVLVRVDFNVPLARDDEGSLAVADDTRIRAALPTIKAIVASGGQAILMSHLGRPKGQFVPELSLAPVASHLESLLEQRVHFVQDIASDTPSDRIVLLENTRFFPGEKKNDAAFVTRLAAMGDVFVNDAFGTAHRAHASNVGISQHMPAASGYLLEREIRYLRQALTSAEHPFVALLGGAKVSDKIGVIAHLLDKVDTLLIGGAMSYTFLQALGHQTGNSLVEEDRIDEARRIFEWADGKILLPTDHVVADKFDNNARISVVSESIPAGMMGLDIGPTTRARYRERILGARTVVWNGPMGVFEMPAFATGTRVMAEALAEATSAGSLTIVGGGDSVAAITQGGYAQAVTHVSTGGGAMLAFLEGQTLPGLAALTNKT